MESTSPTAVSAWLDKAEWTNPPASLETDGDAAVVTAHEGSDAWRVTSYGFLHDNEHAAIVPVGARWGLEVTFDLDFTEQFDQAGIFIRASEEEWIKAGVEISDGEAQVGAVVTHGFSDWSVAPVPEWRGRSVTMRASRDGDAITVRARVDAEEWRLVRVAYLDPACDVAAGLFCCAPSRADLKVRFIRVEFGDPDESLH
jgi:regulation of enolase protein 1 (concanavalin A-like superfamily)